jgi:hypothetical protein
LKSFVAVARHPIYGLVAAETTPIVM